MKRREIKVEMITVSNVCPFCRKFYEIEVPFAGFMAYKSGALVQNAFPTLSPTERECLVSGLCTTCQDKVFGNEG